MREKKYCLVCNKEHFNKTYCSKRCAGVAVGGKNHKDLSGKRFGTVIVISIYDQLPSSMYRWLCRCDCGNEFISTAGHLNKNGIKTCKKCVISKMASANRTHGLSKTKFYKYWRKRMRRDADRTWTLKMDLAIRKTQKGCVICGSNQNLQIDHVVPFQKGGTLKPGNAVVLCKYHNFVKNDKDVSQLNLLWQFKINRAAKQFLDYWNKSSP